MSTNIVPYLVTYLLFHLGTGSLVTATEISAERKATVVGKPGTFIMDCITRE